jgi:peptidoglycan hydrolase-like protein with peptidoglycan-binding domain/multidrug efflux pump subunit AcrA (membrane-fusion protein)
MASKRTVLLSAVLAGATALAFAAWVAGSKIESPADAAARTAPPTPSPILVPVEKRVLSTKIVTRGSGRFGLPQPISIAPSALKASAGLIATLPLRNTQIEEGGVLFTASGRPVFALAGKIPAYRDLTPGISGDDVRQLEQALKRVGYDPGPIDGSYDQQTSAAVAKWYKAKGWEPFGPTREQLVNLFTLEKDWGEAHKTKLAAVAAAAAAAPSVESARATAEQLARVAAAELAAKRTEQHKFAVASAKDVPQAVESERAKAEYANSAAAAELRAQIAEQALIALDPRQPETARAAADAKLEVARAAAAKAKLEGELALQTAKNDASLSAERLQLAEGAVRSARLEGEKAVRAAVDAKKIAELDARLAADRAHRLGSDLEAAKRKLGVQVPVDEIVFIPALPVRVEEIKGAVGGTAGGLVMTVTDNQLAIDSSLALDQAPLVKPGMEVAIDEQALGIKATGVVEMVASTPGTRGVDGYHVYFEVRVKEGLTKIEGVSLRLTIAIQSTKGDVTAVPVSALSLAADGTSRIQVQNKAALEYVVVKPGLSADGFVEVTPIKGTLAPGQLVVVGYKNAESKNPEKGGAQ